MKFAPFRLSAGFVVLSMFVVGMQTSFGAEGQSAAVPAYRFEVGQELVYRGFSEYVYERRIDPQARTSGGSLSLVENLTAHGKC